MDNYNNYSIFDSGNSGTVGNPNENRNLENSTKLKHHLPHFLYRELLYRSFIIDKATTSVPSAQFQLMDEFLDIVTKPLIEETEKERSSLVVSLKEFLNKYSCEGLDILKTYIEIQYRQSKQTLISDILEIIGEVENLDSRNDRRLYLEDQLQSKKEKIRYGSLLGLESILSKESLIALEQARLNENIPVLKELIDEILILLRK